MKKKTKRGPNVYRLRLSPGFGLIRVEQSRCGAFHHCTMGGETTTIGSFSHSGRHGGYIVE